MQDAHAPQKNPPTKYQNVLISFSVDLLHPNTSLPCAPMQVLNCIQLYQIKPLTINDLAGLARYLKHECESFLLLRLLRCRNSTGNLNGINDLAMLHRNNLRPGAMALLSSDSSEARRQLLKFSKFSLILKFPNSKLASSLLLKLSS